ncbi:hypothetical protein JOF29_006912 [Kribbella aluminosa]|uniref:Uncharacterized protein n=1 Tax=Kribbella aluminosa TaxID=416017 RepID=A0ABS4UVZ6_9ACTN|nr:hypothetical protein [Kribbella aluminosa]MBP2355802.1 hypothetical protein [Kribbella aluminosa]
MSQVCPPEDAGATTSDERSFRGLSYAVAYRLPGSATTKLAIDRLRDATVRRESYVGPWRPESTLTTRKAVVARRRRYDTDRAIQQQVTERFLAACENGDVEALMAVPSPPGRFAVRDRGPQRCARAAH